MNQIQNKIDPKALYAIGYGLYAVTSRYSEKDNALIVNTVFQVTSDPLCIAVTVNKENFSHELILKSGRMNVHCLAESAPFSLFQRFGFQSGKDADKFQGMDVSRSENGLIELKESVNALLSLQVEETVELGTHSMFLCSVTESKVLSEENTMTYSYYQKNVKPKPQKEKKTGYVCKVCGWIYEGDELPENIVCPICKHGYSDFEKLAEEKEALGRYQCTVCGWTYDESVGAPELKIPAGTKFEDLPEDFRCALCGMGKDRFRKI